MALSITNSTVSTKAATGTVIGTLSLLNSTLQVMGAEFKLTKNSTAFFGISGSNLVTLNPSLPLGIYSVAVNAVGTKTYWSAKGNFQITVTA
jgi:hypothetical protein